MVADLPEDTETESLRFTRREMARRLATAVVVGAGVRASRGGIRKLLVHVGWSGSGHGLMAALARRLWRIW